MLRAGFHIEILRRALHAGVRWAMKVVTVTDPESKIHRQHNVAATREVLIQ